MLKSYHGITWAFNVQLPRPGFQQQRCLKLRVHNISDMNVEVNVVKLVAEGAKTRDIYSVLDFILKVRGNHRPLKVV